MKKLIEKIIRLPFLLVITIACIITCCFIWIAKTILEDIDRANKEVIYNLNFLKERYKEYLSW